MSGWLRADLHVVKPARLSVLLDGLDDVRSRHPLHQDTRHSRTPAGSSRCPPCPRPPPVPGSPCICLLRAVLPFPDVAGWAASRVWLHSLARPAAAPICAHQEPLPPWCWAVHCIGAAQFVPSPVEGRLAGASSCGCGCGVVWGLVGTCAASVLDGAFSWGLSECSFTRNCQTLPRVARLCACPVRRNEGQLCTSLSSWSCCL